MYEHIDPVTPQAWHSGGSIERGHCQIADQTASKYRNEKQIARARNSLQRIRKLATCLPIIFPISSKFFPVQPRIFHLANPLSRATCGSNPGPQTSKIIRQSAPPHPPPGGPSPAPAPCSSLSRTPLSATFCTRWAPGSRPPRPSPVRPSARSGMGPAGG
jgi:hypothetical protein